MESPTAQDMADYVNDVAAPTPDSLKQLTNLAALAAAAQQDVDRLEAGLKAANERLKSLTEHQIPVLMDEIRLTTFRTTDGVSINVKEIVRASPPKDRRDECYDWFENNGEAGLVKRLFLIKFNREDTAWFNKFKADLARRKKPVNAVIERKIEPPTLLAWVNRKLEAGANIPEELLGVFRQRIAKIVLPE
jgi:hypothetical protein